MSIITVNYGKRCKVIGSSLLVGCNTVWFLVPTPDRPQVEGIGATHIFARHRQKKPFSIGPHLRWEASENGFFRRPQGTKLVALFPMRLEKGTVPPINRSIPDETSSLLRRVAPGDSWDGCGLSGHAGLFQLAGIAGPLREGRVGTHLGDFRRLVSTRRARGHRWEDGQRH